MKAKIQHKQHQQQKRQQQNITATLRSAWHTTNCIISMHSQPQLLHKKGRIIQQNKNVRYNLQRQKTSGMKIPIATATGTSILLESSVAYGSVTRGSAARRCFLGSDDGSCSSSSTSSASSNWCSSGDGSGGSRGTSAAHRCQCCMVCNVWKIIFDQFLTSKSILIKWALANKPYISSW